MLDKQIHIVQQDGFPDQRADLALCNPPWLPWGEEGLIGLDHSVYDPGSKLLRLFLDGLTEHLHPDGEGWLVMSDLAVSVCPLTSCDMPSVGVCPITSCDMSSVDVCHFS